MARRNRISTGNSMGRTMNNIEGLEEVRQMLRTLADLSPQVYEEELTKTIDAVESTAKANVHSVDGNLVSSIKKKITKARTELKGSVSAGGNKAPHAHLVEFGHRQLQKWRSDRRCSSISFFA